MDKSKIIEDLCSDLLHNPIFSQETYESFWLSASLIEDDLSKMDSRVDWTSRSLAEAVKFTKDGFIFCSHETQDYIYTLLVLTTKDH